MQTVPSAASLAPPVVVPPHGTIRIEAETGALIGARRSSAGGGFSGNGYVTGFEANGARVSLPLRATAGLYTVRIGYRSPFGDKGYDMVVNGAKHSGVFPRTGNAFAVCAAGAVELRSGANDLSIEKGWGYYDIDYIELSPATSARGPRKPPRAPVDPRATPEARALLGMLIDRYGAGTLSGQYDAADGAYIRQSSGKTPAIFGADFMEYSPSRVEHGAKPGGTTESILKTVRDSGQILTLSWHWNAPKDLLDRMIVDKNGKSVDARWYKGFYTNATTFDVQRALADRSGADYKLLLRDIDAIAAQLKTVARADVPVLWRPLHEAEGGWFWWGAKGPEAFKQLWQVLFERIVHVHGLHNLLWVFTAGTNPAWYPGDAVVDIVGIDSYPKDLSDPLASDWAALQRRFDGKKLVAVTEFGGVPDIAKMRRYGDRWSYFVTWSGRAKTARPADLSRLYNAPGVINLDGLHRR